MSNILSDRIETMEWSTEASSGPSPNLRAEREIFAVLSQNSYIFIVNFWGGCHFPTKHISMVFRIKWWVDKDGAGGTGQAPTGPDPQVYLIMSNRNGP